MKKQFRTTYFILFIFIFVCFGILFSASIFFNKEKANIKKIKQNELAVVGELKVKQIVNWLNDRIADADMIRNFPQINNTIKQFLNNDEKEAKEILLSFMEYLQSRYDYFSILLIDSELKVRLNIPETDREIGSHAETHIKEAFEKKQTVITDLHRAPIISKIHIDLVIPFFTKENNTNKPIAALLLRIDPHKFLYPLIQSWPIEDPSAETLLVKKDGDHVLFLNDLRHKKNTALTLREPLSLTNLPAAMAVLGVTGVIEGVDYRGVEVLAALYKVPNTTWYMVAKSDTKFAYRQIERLAKYVTFMMILLILIAAFISITIIRSREAVFYKKQYEDELQRRALLQHFEYITKYANDIIFLLDENGNIIEVNDRAVSVYGYTREEFLKLNIDELKSPDATKYYNSLKRDIEQKNGLIFDTEHKRKDGSVFPVEISARIITVDNKKFGQEIVRDITQRRQHEERIAYLTRLYKVLSNVNQTIIRTKNKDILFKEICQILIRDGEFKFVWIGLVNNQTKMVEPVAYDGFEDGYLSNIQVSIEDIDIGRGPTGQSIRNNRPVICANYSEDPSVEPWRKEALKRGYLSSAAFPIILQDKAIGAINIYSDKIGFHSIEEIKLLEELAGDVSFALEILSIEDRKRLIDEEKLKFEAQLRHNQKLEAIGILASGVAHEINNPLTGIINYAQLISDETNIDNRLKNFAEQIIGEGERIAVIVKNLLSFSRFEKESHSSAKVSEIIESVLSLIRSIIKKSQIVIESDIEPNLPVILCRSQQIQQIIMNLITNARDALNAKYPEYNQNKKINIKAHLIEKNGKHFVRITVKDWGTGIKPDVKEHLFEPFYTTKPRYVGTGLGLYISMGIVKDHKGEISIESEPNEFTQVHVDLPVNNKSA